MPDGFDTETFPSHEFPAIWFYQKPPEDKRDFAAFVEHQAASGMLASTDILEAVLRLLLGLTEVEGVYDPPRGYDPEVQGEWDSDVLTFIFRRRVQKVGEDREDGEIRLEYQVETCGTFVVTIRGDSVHIERESAYDGG
jgi:hypothetical protein